VVNRLATAVTVSLPEAAAAMIVEADTVATAMRTRLDPTRPLGRGLARLSRRDRDALVTFYEARDWAPLWMTGTAAAPSARAVADLLARADEDGLDPAAYPVPSLATLPTPASRVEAEIALSAAALAYAHDARGGRLDPTRLSGLITPVLELPDPAVVLAGLAGASDPAALLGGFQPPHAGYRALKAHLREMHDATAAIPAPQPVFEGPPLREGDLDQRVPLLRSRLDLAARSDTVYDGELRRAIAALQKRNRIRATGVFDARTADLLEPHPKARSLRGLGSADIIANMERWRWLPQDLGDRHIMVNLPDFSLRLVEGGRTIHRARVIVGKTETQTPVFSHRMEHVVVNPSWHIPPSIMKNEILPGLARDPDYAARRGYEVVRRGNTISVRQPPGERNALGFIKFMFPNQHSVYLHDTPSRGLFSADRRAFSHGCVRVDQPFRLAEFVLGDQGYTEERLRRLIGSGERTIKLARFLPVHLGYFTVFVDEDGQLQRREDLYGHDGKVKTALGLSADGRRYAEMRR
jgi:murein L,D-transpeptidase YcbB/YkuD